MSKLAFVKKFFVLASALAYAYLAQSALADPVNFIALNSELTAAGNNIDFSVTIPYNFVSQDEDPGQRLKAATDYFSENFTAENRGAPCSETVQDIAIESNSNTFKGKFICPQAVQSIRDLKIQSQLFFEDFADVNNFLKIDAGGAHKEVLLTKRNETFDGSKDLSLAGKKSFFAVVGVFIGLGVPHVLFGLDHVLFILAMHSIVRKLKDILIIVTAFTIAHSLTLIVAGLGFITLTSRVVEPLIAFSIAYTAMRNILIQRGGLTEENFMKERWISAFGFGLVHGLGFAGALAEIQIPRAYFVPALLSFNVGVEIGQFIVIGIFISILFATQQFGYLKRTVYALSGAIALISSIWVIQRIFV